MKIFLGVDFSTWRQSNDSWKISVFSVAHHLRPCALLSSSYNNSHFTALTDKRCRKFRLLSKAQTDKLYHRKKTVLTIKQRTGNKSRYCTTKLKLYVRIRLGILASITWTHSSPFLYTLSPSFISVVWVLCYLCLPCFTALYLIFACVIF